MSGKKSKNRDELNNEVINNPFAEVSSELGFSVDKPSSSDRNEKRAEKKRTSNSEKSPLESVEKVILQTSRKGRGGKSVTLVMLRPELKEKSLSSLCRTLKKSLGCGAWVEDCAIILQGDVVEKTGNYLQKKGVKNIVIGN